MVFSEIMAQERLISIIRGMKKEQTKDVVEALYRGGVRLAEITFDSTGRISPEETAEMIALAQTEMNGRMLIGAGTVITPEQAELTAKAGGQFIISPNCDAGVICKTKECGLISIPAAMTVTEILTAHRSGADYIKIFPADAVGGPAFFKAVRGPFPEIRLLAVSGATPQLIPEYKKCGAYGFGIGSGIVSTKALQNGDYQQIEENARLYASVCRD